MSCDDEKDIQQERPRCSRRPHPLPRRRRCCPPRRKRTARLRVVHPRCPGTGRSRIPRSGAGRRSDRATGRCDREGSAGEGSCRPPSRRQSHAWWFPGRVRAHRRRGRDEFGSLLIQARVSLISAANPLIAAAKPASRRASRTADAPLERRAMSKTTFAGASSLSRRLAPPIAGLAEDIKGLTGPRNDARGRAP